MSRAHRSLADDAARMAVLNVHAAVDALKHGYPAQLTRQFVTCGECDRPGCVGIEHDIDAPFGDAGVFRAGLSDRDLLHEGRVHAVLGEVVGNHLAARLGKVAVRLR